MGARPAGIDRRSAGIGSLLYDRPGSVSTRPRAAATVVWRVLPARLRHWIVAVRHGAPPQRQWMRETMNRDLTEFFGALETAKLDALEVSGNLRSDLPWRSYTSLAYPEFDLCSSTPTDAYDFVICEQVLEHVPDPVRAVDTLHALCRPGGALLVSTPFLVRIHGSPDDFWRFTPNGLTLLLQRGGFDVEWIRSWGNRRCVRRNFGRWLLYQRWRSLDNEPELPMVVWALARRTAASRKREGDRSHVGSSGT